MPTAAPVYRSRLPVCVLLAALAWPQPAGAWGNTGHEAVAYIAWQLMGSAARDQAIALIKLVPQLTSPSHKTVDGYAQWVQELPAGLSDDQKNLYLFMRAATWADAIKHVGFRDSDNPPSGISVDHPLGFTDPASHGYWHFVDAPFTSDSSKFPTATPVPNSAVQIVELRTHLASSDTALLKAYELIWLEHLVGDIHQPMHGVTRFVAGKSDAGGNSVAISLPKDLKAKFEASVPKGTKPNDPRELHAFWDDLPGELNAIVALGPAAEFGKGLAPAKADEVAVTDPSKWAASSFAMAKADGYAAPVGPGNASVAMTDAYYDRALADAKSQIALAGARLAKLLGDIWPEH